mgnify:CR=1 FL=1
MKILVVLMMTVVLLLMGCTDDSVDDGRLIIVMGCVYNGCS